MANDPLLPFSNPQWTYKSALAILITSVLLAMVGNTRIALLLLGGHSDLHVGTNPQLMSFAGIVGCSASLFLLGLMLLRMARQESDLLRERNIRRERQHLIDELRGQRHDFVNHLTVLRALAQLKQHERLILHIDCLTGARPREQAGSEGAPDAHPHDAFSTDASRLAFFALIAEKTEMAATQGVTLQFASRSSSWPSLAIDVFLRIATNVIDNAIEAAGAAAQNGRVVVTLKQSKNQFVLSVWNNGQWIAPHAMRKVFEQGFSSKGPDRGHGLYIVKTLTDKHGGTIAVSSSPQRGTRFVVSLPCGPLFANAPGSGRATRQPEPSPLAPGG